MPWQSLNLNLPPEIQTITQAIGTSLNAVKSALTLIQTQTRVTQALVQTAESTEIQIVNEALQLGVTAITNAINGLLDTTGVYILLIPLPKKGLVSIVSQPDSPDEPGSNQVRIPQQNILNTLTTAVANKLRQSPSFTQIFNQDNLFLGGNPYFVKTVTESIFDFRDRNRPKFDASSSWAYAMFIAGATDVTSILSAASFFDKLFSTARSANRVSASRGVADFVPKNIRIGPSGRGLFPVIEWERIPQSISLLSFDGARVVPDEYAIIRSTDFRSKTATQVTDLFNSPSLVEGMKGSFGSEVIKVAKYDGIINRYIDSTNLIIDQSYFYHVAFKSRIENPAVTSATSHPRNNPNGTLNLENPSVVNKYYNLLSSAAEWRVPSSRTQLTDSRMGQAPDWIRTPSFATLIPGLEKLLDLVQTNLQSIALASNDISVRNDLYLAMLQREIDRLTNQINEINGYLSAMQSIFSTPDAGVFTTLRQGQGSVGSFISDVVLTIDDTTDPNRPSFDNGDEYVTGVVMLCVGPDPAPIAAAFALLESLFGAPTTNEALIGINSIQTTLTNVEQTLIDNLVGATTSTSVPSVAFDNSLNPNPVGTPDSTCK